MSNAQRVRCFTGHDQLLQRVTDFLYREDAVHAPRCYRRAGHGKVLRSPFILSDDRAAVLLYRLYAVSSVAISTCENHCEYAVRGAQDS